MEVDLEVLVCCFESVDLQKKIFTNFDWPAEYSRSQKLACFQARFDIPALTTCNLQVVYSTISHSCKILRGYQKHTFCLISFVLLLLFVLNFYPKSFFSFY